MKEEEATEVEVTLTLERMNEITSEIALYGEKKEKDTPEEAEFRERVRPQVRAMQAEGKEVWFPGE